MSCPYEGCNEGAAGYHRDGSLGVPVAHCMKGHKYVTIVMKLEDYLKVVANEESAQTWEIEM